MIFISYSLHGRPPVGIGGKDVILHILGQFKRNTIAAQRAVEFGGPGLVMEPLGLCLPKADSLKSLQYLSCDARFAICNMCTGETWWPLSLVKY